MMNKTIERYEKIMKVMSPCSKELYFKDEIQRELTDLKKVIVNCTYNEEHAENMRLVHRPFNKYHIKQMQIQSLQYHPFCISSGKQLVPC